MTLNVKKEAWYKNLLFANITFSVLSNFDYCNQLLLKSNVSAQNGNKWKN